MLTDQQKAFFDAFGFLQMKQVFLTPEFEDIKNEADRIFAEDAQTAPQPGHQHIAGFIERSGLLSNLAVDDRIFGVAADLLQKDFVWGNSEENKGSFNEENLHNWHCDRVGEYDLQYARLKVMIYLTTHNK